MDTEEGFPAWKATKRKMELQLDQEEGEDKERSKKVRLISSSNMVGSAQVIFSRSLEPEETRYIDGSEFLLVEDNEIKEKSSMDGSEFLLIEDNEIKEKSSLSEQEVFGRDVVQSVWDAWQRMDEEAIDNILVTACEEILKTPFSPNQYHCINFVYISKKMPEAFSLPKVYKALLKLLSSSDRHSLNKSNLLPIFASKLLYGAFIREFEWPIEFIQSFLEDIVGPSAWIEHESCKDFVGILSNAFQDSIVAPVNKYSSLELRKLVKQQYFLILGKVLKANSTRNNSSVLLKLLLIGADYEDVRLIASSMLGHWINNPIYMHAAEALLDRILQKTCGISKTDNSIVANLFLLKIMNRNSNIYQDMATQLVCKRIEYAAIALKTLVLVELSAKDVSNLNSISTILRAISITASPEHELAMILQELAANDNTRQRLKEFVCRLVRHIGSEINIKALCQYLLQPWMAMVNQTKSLKLAWLTEITELVTVFLLLSTSALAMDESIMALVSLQENYGSSCFNATNITDNSRIEKIEAIRKVSRDLAVFQLEAIAWCMDGVAVYAPNMNGNQFATILKQFLFLGDYESYFPVGEIFGEIECNSLQLLGFCTQASEEVLARVVLLGISDMYSLTMGDALSIIESLVWRAAAFETLFRGLHAKSNQLPSAIIKLASFSLPGVPQESLPRLVYKDKYWQACLVLLLLAVYNPVTIGLYVWEHNSTVRQMMQMVLTGSQKFFAFDDETAGNLKLDDLASETMTSDAKAEELIYSHHLNRMQTNRTASSEIPLDSYDWRGNVAPLNPSGVDGRLPKSIIEELEEVDKVYQLGRLLRECRSPDYFAQITCLQTLSKAWGWLKRILCQEPELVCVLPFMWQCELLYLQEGSVGSGGKNFVDSRKLYLAISKVIIDKSHEKEVMAFVEFLSCKLSDKNSLIRCQARCFFARIFTISFEFLNEVSPSRDSGQISTLNTSFDCYILSRGDMPEESTRTSFPPYYHLEWLERIGTHPNAQAILESLLPAIQHAVLVETTFEVVIAYLKFLEKYSPSFPSLLSFSCTIARLFVQRKELAACLLSMEKEKNLHTAYLSSSISRQDIYTPDFILNSLYEALRVGTSCQSTDEDLVGIESSIVTLVVHQTDGGDKVSFRHITIYKIVLDAVILVLSLSSSKENHGKGKNVIIQNMIEFLFPNVAGKTSLSRVESMTRKNLPLLSKEEAIIFSQSKDERIAFAGCNALSINAILELCEGLGIPIVTVDHILGVLDSTIGFRIEDYLDKAKERNAWFLQSCLQTLCNFSNKCFPNLSWILSQLSSNSFLHMVPFIMDKPIVVL